MSDYYENKMQAQVADFHEKLGHPINDVPQFSRPELRARLILEEAIETAVGLVGSAKARMLFDDACIKEDKKLDVLPNIVEVADGMADVLYVVFGTAVEMGIDLQQVFDVVHASNLAKANGPKDEHGKSLKPPGWTPPDIAKVLREQGWKG